ncbi:MAG: hypothetical protein LBE80_06065 [Deltaproteobacteria bacterium]|jgi:regulator of protease activity HflC (stomatin/prohibitin superfamily)|nr:hypothetical protein [Deltaproteobacteria bacterium]
MAQIDVIIETDEELEPEIDTWDGRKWRFFWWSILTALILVILWPYIIVKIEPGYVGVLYRRFFGGTEMNYIFKEGTHTIFPWDTMYKFDVRLHEDSYNLSVLNKSGLIVDLQVTIIYQPISISTPILLTNVGVNYSEKIIKPMLRSTVVDTIAKHNTEELFNENISIIKDEILVGIITSLGRLPIRVNNILIKEIKLPNDLNQAINQKLVAQQKVTERHYQVLQALEGYKQAYVEASSVRMTQEIVNPLLSESFLRLKGIEATREVALSPNSKVVIMGNKDGLPVILNLDGASGQASPSPASPPSQRPPSPGSLEPGGPVSPEEPLRPEAGSASAPEGRPLPSWPQGAPGQAGPPAGSPSQPMGQPPAPPVLPPNPSYLDRVEPSLLDNLIAPFGQSLSFQGPVEAINPSNTVQTN